MNDKINTNLDLAGSIFPLKVKPEEEENIRKAAKQVNDWLNKYRDRYPGLTTEKLIAMVAFQFSLEKIELLQRNDTQPYLTKIEKLTEMLEEYFENE